MKKNSYLDKKNIINMKKTTKWLLNLFIIILVIALITIIVNNTNTTQIKTKKPIEKDTTPSVTVNVTSFDSKGNLKVITNPSNSEIYWDLQYLGNSPLIIKDLPMGKQSLFIYKEGYLPYSMYKPYLNEPPFIVKNKLNKLNINLVKTKPRYNKGYIHVETKPSDANVYLDGSPFRRITPTIYASEEIGNHSIKIEKKGYTTIEFTFTLEPHELEKIKINLQKEK